MVFASPIFLFAFLPAFLAAYYLTPPRARSAAILLGSYVFYGWWRIDFLGLLIVVTLATHWIGLKIAAADASGRRYWCGLGVAGLLGVLGYFKYVGFFLDSFAVLIGADPGALAPHWRVVLPIGISFYVFQAISYLVDVTRRDAEPASSLVDLAAFLALFPQLIAGPILRYKDLASQFADRRHSWALFTEGARRFMLGFARKVLIADAAGQIADAAFALPAPTFADATLGTVAYAVQLYFDFSGYSSMAIGLGLMMGFRFTENFDTPYWSRSLSEFWRRWHISLSTWLRDYLYIPLGGSHGGPVRTYANLIVTMALGGLWHGANVTFLVWGLWHGLWLSLERAFSRYVPAAALRPAMLAIVLLGWIPFRAVDAAAAVGMLRGLTGANGFGLGADLAWQIAATDAVLTLTGIVIVLIEPMARRLSMPDAAVEPLVLVVMVAAVVALVADGYSPFLYFQF